MLWSSLPPLDSISLLAERSCHDYISRLGFCQWKITEEFRSFERDVFSLFEEGTHLARFIDPNDLTEKIKYYLDHSTEREGVARHGMREVLEKHTYVHQIQELLSVVSRNQLKKWRKRRSCI